MKNEPTPEVLDAFALLIHAFPADHTQLYKVLLNDKSVSFRGVRLWRTVGAAKTAVNSAIYQVMWHYDYWSTYNDNQASRITSATGITKEMLDNAFKTLSPDYRFNSDSKKIKEIAKIVLGKMLETGIVKIEKA